MADKRLKEKRKIFVNSVSEDTVDNLLDDLLSEKVLNQEEIEIVKKTNVTTIAKARDLIDFVICKGSRVSQIFIDYICKRDSTLAYKLEFSSAFPETLSRRTESASTEPIGKLKLCPREKFLEICKMDAGMIYPIRKKGDRTRLALIICNTDFDHFPRRNGFNHDIIGMKGLLEDLDYSVHVEENLTARAMELVLRTFATRPEHESSDSTFLVFMSHVILDRICGTMHSDEKPDVLSYDTIFQIFNNRNCSYLKDKPKVIIIQACRGVFLQQTVENCGSVTLQQPQQTALHSLQRMYRMMVFARPTWRKISLLSAPQPHIMFLGEVHVVLSSLHNS
nr:caspase-1-like isoform X3 [Equus asinus]